MSSTRLRMAVSLCKSYRPSQVTPPATVAATRFASHVSKNGVSIGSAASQQKRVPLELLEADAKLSGPAFMSSHQSAPVSSSGNHMSSVSELSYTASSSDAQDPNQPYDPYSKDPTGLQTAYRKETEDIASGKRQSFTKEMEEAMTQPDIDDGYGRDPTGMQTSYSKEHETGKSLEHELTEFERSTLEAKRGLGSSHVDEYPATPVGLELSFKQEFSEGQDGRSKLEHELFTRSKSFVEAERGLGSSHADEFPESLQGLQTSYMQEQSSGMTLEQELAQQHKEASEAQAGLGSTHHDEFPMASQGLQQSYKAERDDTESGKRVPLEHELRQPWNDSNTPTVGESLKGQLHVHKPCPTH